MKKIANTNQVYVIFVYQMLISRGKFAFKCCFALKKETYSGTSDRGAWGLSNDVRNTIGPLSMQYNWVPIQIFPPSNTKTCLSKPLRGPFMTSKDWGPWELS